MIEDAKTILKTYRELRLPDYPVTQVLGRCLHESSIAILHYGLGRRDWLPESVGLQYTIWGVLQTNLALTPLLSWGSRGQNLLRTIDISTEGVLGRGARQHRPHTEAGHVQSPKMT